jgi:hypothetical protein
MIRTDNQNLKIQSSYNKYKSLSSNKWSCNQILLDQLAALPTLGMPVDSFLASASTLKVEPHTCPELSTLGTGFNSLSGCSKLLKPPDVVKKHPEMKSGKIRYLLHETVVFTI